MNLIIIVNDVYTLFMSSLFLK